MNTSRASFSCGEEIPVEVNEVNLNEVRGGKCLSPFISIFIFISTSLPLQVTLQFQVFSGILRLWLLLGVRLGGKN
jgi:hypothetical protein